METVYESDPEHTYNYHYYLIDHRNDGLGFHRMYYTVFDATNTQCGYYLPFDPPEQGE